MNDEQNQLWASVRIHTEKAKYETPRFDVHEEGTFY